MKPYFDPYINYKFSKEMEDKLDEILESNSPEEAKVNFLNESYKKIQDHVRKYGEPDPVNLTSYPLPFDTRYELKLVEFRTKLHIHIYRETIISILDFRQI